MEIGILREFVCLTKTLNFTVAAKQCYISQSVLSKHINNLETEVGSALFARSRQGVSLTSIGKEFATDVEKILELYDGALKKIERSKADNAGVLKIAFLAGAARPFLHKACHDFIEKNENAETILQTMEGSALFEALDGDDVDVVIAMVFDETPLRQYRAYRIYNDFYGAIVSKDVVDPGKDRLTKEDIGEMSIAIPNKKRFREEWFFLKRYLEQTAPGVETIDAVNSTADFGILPFSGKYVVMAPNHEAYSLDPALRFLPLDAPPLMVGVSAIWKRSNDNPMIPSFIESIESTMGSMEEEDFE